MPNAQDQAFTILALQRGLPPDRFERVEALRREHRTDEPVAQLLLKAQLLPPEVVASLLRDLARRTFQCERCEGRVGYDGLAQLSALSCPRCGSPLSLGPGDPSSGAFAAVAPPGARPVTGRYPAVAPSSGPSGGFPAVPPPSSPPSGGYPAVAPSSGGYAAVVPPVRASSGPAGFPAVPAAGTGRPGDFHRASTTGSTARGGVPASTARLGPASGPPAPPAPHSESGALVRPTWTVEETVIDRNRRRTERPSETGRALPAMLDRPSEGAGRTGSLDRPSEGTTGRRTGSLDRPSEGTTGRRTGSLDRPSEGTAGRPPVGPLDRPSELARPVALDRPSEGVSRPGSLDRPSEGARRAGNLDRPSELGRRAEPAPPPADPGRWDADSTVLEKHRQSRAAEAEVTDTVKEDIGILPLTRGTSTASAVARTSSHGETHTEETVRDATVLRPPLQEGGKLGAYTILAELGRGAGGVIYLAKRQGLERRFALKVLQQGEGPLDEGTIARFQREAQVASRIQDPGIIGVFDIGHERDIYYYAMDYVPGPTLEERLQGGPLPTREAAEVIMRLARSIHVAHEHGVIHRDLKPSNVIVDETSGRPRITDFGVARDQSLLKSITKTGELLGTPTHMAPEQLLGEGGIDRRVDVYALGVMLYECLTGKPPFDGPTAIAVAEMACSTDPAPPRVHFPDLPRELERVCLKAMARERAKRHPDAAQLADDLQRYLDGTPPLLRTADRVAAVRGVPRVVIGAALVSATLALGVLLRSALVSGEDPGQNAPGPTPADPGLRGLRDEVARLRERLEQARSDRDLGLVEADLASLRTRSASEPAQAAAVKELDRELETRRLLQQALARGREREPLQQVVPLFERAAQAAGGDPRLRGLVQLEQARFSRRRGRLEDARVQAEQLLSDTGRLGLLARLERAATQVLEERPDEALHMLTRVVELDPSGGPGLFAKAWERSLRDDGPAAGAALASALEREPDLVPALVLGGRLETVRRGFEQAERHLQRAEALAPDDPEVHLAWAGLHQARGNLDRALGAVTQAVELCEPRPPRPYLLERGILAVRMGRHERALSDLTRAVEIRADVPALFYRALVYLQQSSPPLAEADLSRARSLDPKQLERLVAMLDPSLQGSVRQLIRGAGGDASDPLSGPRPGDEPSPGLLTRLAERARRVAPGGRDALLGALRVTAGGGSPAEVEAAFQRAAEAAPDDPLIGLERARALVGRELLSAAQGAMEAARRAGASELDLLLLEGELAFRQGRTDQARARWEELRGRDKGGPLGHCARARLELLEGRAEQALDLAELAQNLPPAPGTGLAGPPAAALLIQVQALVALLRPREALTLAQRALDVEGFQDAVLALARAQAAFGLAVGAPQAPTRPTAERLRALRTLFDQAASLSAGAGVRAEAARAGLSLASLGDAEALPWGRRVLDATPEQDHPQLALVSGAFRMEQDGDAQACLAAWRRARQLQPGLRPPGDFQQRFRERFPAATGQLEQLLRE